VTDTYCRNCRNELAETDRFCPRCGTCVHEAADAPTPEGDADVPSPPQQGAATTPPPDEGGSEDFRVVSSTAAADKKSGYLDPDDRSQEEKDLDRLIQARLEYWKTQYDFQKHITTVGLLAAAGFTALLGGFFKDKCPWALDQATGAPTATLVIISIYVAVFLSGFFASRAALFASRFIESGQVRHLQATDDTNSKEKSDEKRFEQHRTRALIMLAFAIGLLVVFIVGDMVLYSLFGFNECPTG
jgi:hypothetical protein